MNYYVDTSSPSLWMQDSSKNDREEEGRETVRAQETCMMERVMKESGMKKKRPHE